MCHNEKTRNEQIWQGILKAVLFSRTKVAFELIAIFFFLRKKTKKMKWISWMKWMYSLNSDNLNQRLWVFRFWHTGGYEFRNIFHFLQKTRITLSTYPSETYPLVLPRPKPPSIVLDRFNGSWYWYPFNVVLLVFHLFVALAFKLFVSETLLPFGVLSPIEYLSLRIFSRRCNSISSKSLRPLFGLFRAVVLVVCWFEPRCFRTSDGLDRPACNLIIPVPVFGPAFRILVGLNWTPVASPYVNGRESSRAWYGIDSSSSDVTPLLFNFVDFKSLTVAADADEPVRNECE